MLKRRRTEQDEMLTTRHFSRSAPARTPPPSEPSPEPAPSPAARSRRRRRRASFLRQIAAVAGLLVLGYATLPFLLNADRMQPIVEEILSRNLGRRVRIGALRFSPTFGTLVATDVSIADDPAFSSAPFFHARRVDLSVRRIPLILRRAVELTHIGIEEPTVTLIGNARQWNFHAILSAGPPPGDTTPGPSLEVERGILVIRSSDRLDPFVLRDVKLDAPRFSTALQNPFALSAAVAGGGTVKLSGNWGPVIWRGRAPALPMNILVNAKSVALADSGLVAAVAPAVAGSLSIDGTMESDGDGLHMKGNGAVDKLRLSAAGDPAGEPLNFNYDLSYDFVSRTGALSHLDLTLYKGGAGIQGKYSLEDDGATVKLQIEAQGVPVTPLAGLLPASGVPLPPGASLQGGVAFLALSIEGNLKAPVASGTLSINNTRLMSFDLEDRLSSVDGLDLLHVSRDLAIDEWRSNVSVTPEKVALSDIEANVPEIGIFTGRGEIDANRTLNFQMEALRNGVADKRPISFVVRGACVSPIFRLPGKTG